MKNAVTGSLVSLAPFLTLRNDLVRELDTLRTLAPGSDSVPALETLCERLESAIDCARNVDVWMTVDAVVEKTGRPRSTITRLCRSLGQAVGASKVRGAWTIHWPRFEDYLATGDSNLNKEEVA
jgi:hypothetical protein